MPKKRKKIAKIAPPPEYKYIVIDPSGEFGEYSDPTDAVIDAVGPRFHKGFKIARYKLDTVSKRFPYTGDVEKQIKQAEKLKP